MSSTPLRKSPGSDLTCKARSKLSTTGSSDLIATAAAWSRKSCFSLAARRRTLSNSACARAKRSCRESRSAFSFCNSARGPGGSPGPGPPAGFGEPSSPSPGGSSCSRSIPAISASDFPLDFFITSSALLRFIQDLVEQTCDVRHRGNRVLIIHARWANDGQRTHHFVSGMGRGADEHKILHRGERLVEADHDSHGILLHVEVSAETLNHFFFLFRRFEDLLQTLTIVVAGDQVRCAFHEYHLRALLAGERTLLIELLD